MSNLIHYHPAAVDIISEIRLPVNLEPCLLAAAGNRTKNHPTRSALMEADRREVERGLLQELSRYCPLGWKQKVWASGTLVLAGEHAHGVTTRHTGNSLLT